MLTWALLVACDGVPRCRDPQPVLQDGVSTGIVRCEGGRLDRREAVPVAPITVVDDRCGGGTDPACWFHVASMSGACGCRDQCGVDASDCGAGMVCVAAEVSGARINTCAPVGCEGPEDCASGVCGVYARRGRYCMLPDLAQACRSADDTCFGDEDCPDEACVGDPELGFHCAPRNECH